MVIVCFECRGAPGIAEDVTKLAKVLMNHARPSRVKSCDPKLARINICLYTADNMLLYHREVIRSKRCQCKQLPDTLFETRVHVSTGDGLGVLDRHIQRLTHARSSDFITSNSGFVQLK